MAIKNLLARLAAVFGFEPTNHLGRFLSHQPLRRAILRQRARSDREGSTFSLLTISLLGGDRKHRRRLIALLQRRLRWTDEAGLWDDGRIGVILPDTSRLGAAKLMHDLGRLAVLRRVAIDCTSDIYPQRRETDRSPDRREAPPRRRAAVPLPAFPAAAHAHRQSAS